VSGSKQPSDELDVGRALSFGVVGKAHGLDGWMRVRPYRRDTEGLLHVETVWFSFEGRLDGRRVLSVRGERSGYLLLVEGCGSRTEAERFKGAELLLSRDELPALGPDEFYLVDCIGAEAQDLTGASLGRVVDLLDAGGRDLFVVRDGAEDLLVPATEPFFVDVRDGRVILTDVDGLPKEHHDSKAAGRRTGSKGRA